MKQSTDAKRSQTLPFKMYDEVIFEGRPAIYVGPYNTGHIIERSDHGWGREANHQFIPDEYVHKKDRFWSVSLTEISPPKKKIFKDPYKQELYDTIQELKRASAEIRRDVL